MSDKVSVIIINWNGEQFIDRCLTSLLAQTVTPYEIILVDNASTDGSLEIVRRFPSVRLLAQDSNTGFARGNNLAINAAAVGSEWIALLNPDAFPAPRWLEECLLSAQLNPQFDIFASKLLNAADPTVLDGAGDTYHVSGLVWRTAHGNPAPALQGSEYEVFSPCAAAALYRRSALLEVGGFDEDFFCYVEDVDLGFRLRLAGYRCLYVPKSVVHHVGSGTTGGINSDFSVYHGHRNLVWTFVKNMPGLLFWLLLPLHVMLNLMSIVWFAFRGQGRLVWRAKRDALLGLPKMRRKRQQIQKSRIASISDIWRVLDKRLISIFRKLSDKIVFKLRDNASVMVLAQRTWQAAAGAITLAFVAHFLSPVEQGYFYTLAAIAALYMVLDMGLSSVLVLLAAREFIGLSWGVGGKVEGADPSRFLSLVRLSLCWYGMAAMVFLLLYPAGVAFLDSGHGDLGYDLRGPWALLVLATAAGFLFLPALALSEGSGSGGVAEVFAVRLVQSLLGGVVAWVVLAMGGGLYAVVMMPTVSAVVAGVWLFVRRRRMVLQALKEKTGYFHWRVEVWPLQWRIGASWLAGYTLVLMHVPLLFRTQGPVVAGQMGVTMTVANMLVLIALSWMTARIPTMTRAISTKNWVNLDHVFWREFRSSCMAFVAGAILFFIMRLALEWTPYGVRFLSVAETAGLLMAMGIYHVSGLFATYLRAHLREPFLWPSLIGAVLTASAAIWVAPQWGATGIVTVLVVINALFFLPAALWLLVTLRRKWHCETA